MHPLTGYQLPVNLPPAKPGAYWVSASKAPTPREPPEGGWLHAEPHRVVSLVPVLLMPDVCPYHVLVQTDRRNKVPSGPEHLPGEVPRSDTLSFRKLLRLLAKTRRFTMTDV